MSSLFSRPFSFFLFNAEYDGQPVSQTMSHIRPHRFAKQWPTLAPYCLARQWSASAPHCLARQWPALFTHCLARQWPALATYGLARKWLVLDPNCLPWQWIEIENHCLPRQCIAIENHRLLRQCVGFAIHCLRNTLLAVIDPVFSFRSRRVPKRSPHCFWESLFSIEITGVFSGPHWAQYPIGSDFLGVHFLPNRGLLCAFYILFPLQMINSSFLRL
jgi:hypothetical protein